MTTIKSSQYQGLIIIFLAVITIIGGIVAGPGCSRGQPIEISMPEPIIQEQTVYIGGAVNVPGFYPLKAGDTLESLLQAAGGLTSSAEISRLKLYIPLLGEAESPQKIDINRAPAWLLEALPGIGEVRAQAIIDYRSQNGPFDNTNELLKVAGIGITTYEKIKHLITVADE